MTVTKITFQKFIEQVQVLGEVVQSERDVYALGEFKVTLADGRTIKVWGGCHSTGTSDLLDGIAFPLQWEIQWKGRGLQKLADGTYVQVPALYSAKGSSLDKVLAQFQAGFQYLPEGYFYHDKSFWKGDRPIKYVPDFNFTF